MNVRVLEAAREELDEAVSYYNSQVAGLGDAYHADKTGVLVVAVAHTHRQPGYWRDRLKGR